MSLPHLQPPSPIEEVTMRDEEDIVQLEVPASNERFTVKTLDLDHIEEDDTVDQLRIRVDFQEPEKRLPFLRIKIGLNG